jgi:GNAT superfamily N-acetyltransferase
MSMSDILIRPYADGDLGALAELVTALGYPSTPEQLAKRMQTIETRPEHATFVVERDGRIIAWVGVVVAPTYEHDAPVCRITGLTVADDVRRSGVGRRLMERAESWARESGAERMSLTSHLRRADAHAFYRGIGYQDTGLRFVKDLRD